MLERTTGQEPQRSSSIARPVRYRRLKRFFIILASLVSLTPLIIMTVVSYNQDRKALNAEIKFTVAQMLSNTKRTLEFVIEERRSSMSLILRERSYDELGSRTGLASAFHNLKKSFGGFIDLGLIDVDGTQKTYTGPYDLKGKNYRNQEWFHAVNLRGVYVSDVFMGHRNFPHFIIAVKNESEKGDFFILRATIDMANLDRQIHSVDYSRSFDAFIINREGILQTASPTYGDMFKKCPLEVPSYSGGREVIDEYEINGETVILGHSYIEGSPFILMVTNNQKSSLTTWMSSRPDLMWFLVITTILVLTANTLSALYMVNKMRQADQHRAKAFHNIEYTNKMATIGRMAAGVAHEINNPLAIINEKAGLLKDMVTFSNDYPHKEKLLRSIESIIGSVSRCSVVTHRLLGFGRRMEPRSEAIDLTIIINEVLGFLQKEAEHRDLLVDMHSSESSKIVHTDRGQLQQVFLNILNNAFAAVEDGGKIDISIGEPTDGKIAVAIQDNGSGISEENLKNIFEPFFSTKGEFGTGLGLSITYDIVEKIGGDIEVDSHKGEGTRFTIILPVN